ncbi:hypothetical protein JTE90_023085 [Oedothorax gibbosus]|uniref:Peptidase S1 domain-containing protein n=1 Tax=Oedothorax gibbosus TaxID=931172 RepID=A0AAV6UWM5_9ARAC|nr:hypothetical protein JTE90_023085 [Oedothorax gibbosus]
MEFVTNPCYLFLVYDENLCRYKNSNSCRTSSFSCETWMELSTSTTQTNPITRKTIGTTTINVTKSSTVFSSIDSSSSNSSGIENGFQVNENLKNINYSLFRNTTSSTQDITPNSIIINNDNEENVNKDLNSFNDSTITISEFDARNFTDTTEGIPYTTQENESSFKNTQIKYTGDPGVFDTESSIEPITYTTQNLIWKNSGTSIGTFSSSIKTTNFDSTISETVDGPTNFDKILFNNKKNQSNEFLTTEISNHGSSSEQTATKSQIFLDNQRTSFSDHSNRESENQSYNSEKTTPLYSSDNEKITNKHTYTNIEVTSEKSFTIYGALSTSYTTKEKHTSPISTTRKEDTFSSLGLSTTNSDSKTPGVNLPNTSKWAAQTSLPASFHSLVAQLTSEEISSITTLKMDFGSHTSPTNDKSTLKNPSSHTNKPFDLDMEEEYNFDKEFDSNNPLKEHLINVNTPALTTVSLKETKPIVVEDRVTSNQDSYNKTTPHLFSHSTNFPVDDEFSEYGESESTAYLHETYNHNHELKNPSSTTHFDASTYFEDTEQSISENMSYSTVNVLETHHINADDSKTDSINFNVTSYNIAPTTFEPSNDIEPTTFVTSSDNTTIPNTLFDSNWIETFIYGNISKIPEIINNHASKNTTIIDFGNHKDEVREPLVNIPNYPLEVDITANKGGHQFTTPNTSLSPALVNSHKNSSRPSSDNSIEIEESSFTDAYLWDLNTSQNKPLIPTISTNEYPVNDTTTFEDAIFKYTNVTFSDSTFPEKTTDFESTDQLNYTVFTDDLYSGNSYITDSLSQNNVTYQLHVFNTSTLDNLITAEDNAVNDSEVSNAYEPNVSSSLDSISTKLIMQLFPSNVSTPLITEVLIDNSHETQHTNTTDEIPSSFPSTNTEILEAIFNTTYSKETLESSTYLTDRSTISPVSSSTNFAPLEENSTFLFSHTTEDKFAQKYNITVASHSPTTSTGTSMHDSKISTMVPESSSNTVTEFTQQVTKWNYKKDCGVRLMQPIGRIVGGKNTYFGKWPWQALVKEATWLGLFVKNKCGGVLITAKYVLTAAHCQPGFFASLLVVLGTHDLSETFNHKASVIRNVKRMVVHRHYNAQTFENDLALLEMETPVEFSPYVVPICLPFRKEDFTGKMAFVTGWGKLTHGGDVPNILQEVQVPIVGNGDCQSMFFHAGHQKAIRSNFVCAGYTNGGQDSCEGDSGGPLMVQREDNRWVLVGTVSHGIGCADPNLPGVYMRMSSYRPWIDSIINKP